MKHFPHSTSQQWLSFEGMEHLVLGKGLSYPLLSIHHSAISYPLLSIHKEIDSPMSIVLSVINAQIFYCIMCLVKPLKDCLVCPE